MSDDKKNGMWHAYTPILPVKLKDGTYSLGFGQVYRRWAAGKWEYRQDEETEKEFLDRQY